MDPLEHPRTEEYPRNEFTLNRFCLEHTEYHAIIRQIQARFPR